MTNKIREVASALQVLTETRRIVAQSLPTLRLFLSQDSVTVIGSAIRNNYFGDIGVPPGKTVLNNDVTLRLRRSQIVFAGTLDHRYEFIPAERPELTFRNIAFRYAQSNQEKVALMTTYAPRIERRSSLRSYCYEPVWNNPLGFAWNLVNMDPAAVKSAKPVSHGSMHEATMRLRKDILAAMRTTKIVPHDVADEFSYRNGFEHLVSAIESNSEKFTVENYCHWSENSGTDGICARQHCVDLSRLDNGVLPIMSFAADPDITFLFPGPVVCVDNKISWRNLLDEEQHKNEELDDIEKWLDSCSNVSSTLLELSSAKRMAVISSIGILGQEVARLVSVAEAMKSLFAIELLSSKV